MNEKTEKTESSDVQTALFELHKLSLEFNRDTAKLILNRLGAIEDAIQTLSLQVARHETRTSI